MIQALRPSSRFTSLPRQTALPIALIGDRSSSFLSRPIPSPTQHALIYAGVPENVGPPGLTILIVRLVSLADTTAAIEAEASPVPTAMSYTAFAGAGSLCNTPLMFNIHPYLLAITYYLKNGS